MAAGEHVPSVAATEAADAVDAMETAKDEGGGKPSRTTASRAARAAARAAPAAGPEPTAAESPEGGDDEYGSVEVAGAVTLDVIAECAGVGLEEIEALNPSLLRGSTPPQGATSVFGRDASPWRQLQ